MKRGFLLLLLASLLLAACQFDVTADLYLQDVIDVQEAGETILTNATLALEIGGADEAEKQQIVAILNEQLHEVENVREEERDYSTYLVVDYKIPIIYADDVEGIYSHSEIRNHIFTFALSADNSLNLTFNKPRFDTLSDQLYEEFYQRLNFEDFSMRLYLQNDLRDDIDVTLYSVYANSVPLPYSSTFTLGRRDEIEIRFSDVLRDSVTTPQEMETTGIAVRKFAELVPVAG